MKNGEPPRNGEGEAHDKTPPLSRFDAREQDFDGANDEALSIKYSLLQQEHADLDAAIRALESQPHHDGLSIARLKKKKLQLKDRMQEVKDRMTPDIIA